MDEHVSHGGGLEAPFAVVDLDALNANADDLVQRARGLPIRVASKSVRCTAILRHVLARPGFNGILAYSLPEAIHLVHSGVSDDVVVAYPTTQREAVRTLAGERQLAERITLMVDHPDQLEFLERAAPQRSHALKLCVDLDCSLRAGKLHLGARRSPIHTPHQAVALTDHVVQRINAGQRYRVVGLMGYEAQIAGVTDSSPAVRVMKRFSVAELARRRAQAVHAVREVLARMGQPPLEFVNGGGTGSLDTTAREGAVTEVAAGSGLFGPHLFDHYRSFRPRAAALFAVDVVRHPAPGLVTVYGGGWVASGASGSDRLPVPVWPPGLKLLAAEGAGEVQTPLAVRGHQPGIGTRVWMRHTKAGELCEHVNDLHLIHSAKIMNTVPTYRGEGKAF
ncbi:amino acid deaminase/aldolase [Kocuria sp.]|uniref:amino acid deaminase/aldolase n=1 Tax=Kocuria sp. TaxID=1871328 RepID=UPI0026E0E028|nr:amino acid deaminase/aldolase [Kocuria sp.]MDO5617228.1 amino acid deaminase/aldolase [Kocuria sp.]